MEINSNLLQPPSSLALQHPSTFASPQPAGDPAAESEAPRDIHDDRQSQTESYEYYEPEQTGNSQELGQLDGLVDQSNVNNFTDSNDNANN